MKKFYVLAMLAPLALAMNARQLSPEEAMVRLSAGPAKLAPHSAVRTDLKPAFTVRKNNFTSLYVFNSASDGYMIVSADDCAVPLLGYSDTGSFDADSIPPQLQGWLDFYAAEIEAAAATPAAPQSAVAQTRPERPAIAPLTTSKWNQDAPYNDDCPIDNGKRSVTGCVATAMAQLMYYHQWPVKGTGSKSYLWEVGDSTLSVNFADITFDWADMTPTYGKESTAAQKQAVAELMYACGVSVHMHYTSGESGAASLDIGPALKTYFGYAPDMASPQRYFYGLIDWENMVYGQLAQGLPVLYNGQGSIGGHQFICDGYSSDGYFHFNWGWSGMSDGYYLLSALDPMEQGIGGNLTGFDYEQGIWINVKPASADSTETVVPYIYGYGNFGTTATGAVELGKSVTFEASKNFLNFTAAELEGSFGIAIEAADSTTQYVAHDGEEKVSFYSGPHSFTVTLPSTIADGTYTVTPAFRTQADGVWYPVLCSLSGVQALTMTVADGKATFASAEPAAVKVNSLTQNTPFYFGSKFSVTVDFSNPGTQEYYGEMMLALVNDEGKRVDNALMSEALNLPAGQEATVDIVSDFPRVVNKTDTVAPGEYYLQLYEYMTGNVLYTSTDKVNIGIEPKTTLAIAGLQVESEAEASADKVDVNFTGSVECTEGYFSGQLQIRVYRKNATATSAKAKTDFIFADPGTDTPFTVTAVLSDAKEGDEYYAEMWWNGTQVGDEKYPFTIRTELSSAADDAFRDDVLALMPREGFVEVVSASGAVRGAIYTVDGTAVRSFEAADGTIATDGLTPGAYIVAAADNAGHSAVLKLMIR